MSALIQAQGLQKRYGKKTVLDNVSFGVAPGRIVGLIGPNGAGKTTLLKALLGLIRVDGALSVLGLDPVKARAALMHEVAFIADVALLPRWLQVGDAIDFVAGIHPRFRRDRCEAFLARAGIDHKARIKTLSKGMVVKVHLAIVTAIDARLLVLDEPTLGLDILARRQFYDGLVGDYMDGDRTILITTHQVEEVEHLLTDLLFIDQGRIVLDASMDSVAQRFHELVVHPDHVAGARALQPIAQRELLGRSLYLYEGLDPALLLPLGEVRTPSVADLFIAKLSGGVA
ncbi:MAG: ABC transporter ATP-binding protein [Pseudomonadota bacterium]|jgi:ABC-2 type transport system ATP-binding protein